jgi:hypothetical protein
MTTRLDIYLSFIKLEILDSYNCWTNIYIATSLETTNLTIGTLSEIIICCHVFNTRLILTLTTRNAYSATTEILADLSDPWFHKRTDHG